MISPLPLRQIGQETILIFINMKHLFHSLLAVAFVLCAGFQQAVDPFTGTIQMGGILVQQRLFHGDVLCTAA